MASNSAGGTAAAYADPETASRAVAARMGRVSEQPGRYQRSFSGLAAALIVLVAIVGGMVLLQRLNNAASETNPAPPVPYATTLKLARQQAHLHLLAPATLPPGWRATSVRYADPPNEHWHLGVLTAKDKYVGLEQANAPIREMVRTYVDKRPHRLPPVTVDGATWTAWSDAGGDYALCRRQGKTTTLVVGTPGRAVITDYVASLR